MRPSFLSGTKAPAIGLIAAAAAVAVILREPDSDIAFLVAPVAQAVGWFTGSPYVPEGDGMAFPSMGMIIDRSCSGATFLMVLLFVSALFLWRSRAGARTAWVCALALLVLAYPITLVVNSARIISILQVQRMLGPLSPASHEALGAFVLLSFLFMYSLLATHLMRPAHARTA